jgi:hypothetical protein
MSLDRIDRVAVVRAEQPAKELIEELRKVLNETTVRLMHVNNECTALRQELSDLRLQAKR